MHIWDTVVSHCTQTDVMRYFLFLGGFLMENRKQTVRILAESAVMVALATILSMLQVWDSPYGGSVTVLSMAPIILLSMRHGVKTGLLAGFAYSVIQLLQGLSNLAWIPTPMGIVLGALLDYILPFTLLGLAGLLRNVKIGNNAQMHPIYCAALGALMVTVIRYACHVISGVVIWYELDLEWYADDPTHIVNLYGPWMFSIIYSAICMVPEIIATTIGTGLLNKALAKFNV